MVQSSIDHFSEPNKVSGWVYDEGNVIDVIVQKNGKTIGRGKNSYPRADLEAAGLGACAYEIETSEPFSYYDVLSQAIMIFYQKEEKNYEIKLRDEIIKTIKFKIFSKLIEDFQSMNLNELEMYMYNERKNIDENKYYAELAAISSIINNKNKLTKNDDISKKLSPIYVRVGTMSPDLQCEVGMNGHLFLTRGSNNVISMYEQEYNSENLGTISDKWLDVFKKRKDFCETIGAQFLQVVIPDKLSGLREQYDGLGSTPSPLLHVLERKVSENNLSNFYVSGMKIIKNLGFSKSFRKIDTHFQPAGGHAIFEEICQKISPSYIVPAQFNINYISDGDIGKRFFGQELYEVCSRAAYPSFHKTREILEEVKPKPGKFTGGRMIFRNKNAPFPEKIVGFGNSFMNDYISQASLGYWFSTFFREFHLITQPDIDQNYVKNVKPDFVICQTVERFLGFVPDF